MVVKHCKAANFTISQPAQWNRWCCSRLAIWKLVRGNLFVLTMVSRFHPLRFLKMLFLRFKFQMYPGQRLTSLAANTGDRTMECSQMVIKTNFPNGFIIYLRCFFRCFFWLHFSMFSNTTLFSKKTSSGTAFSLAFCFKTVQKQSGGLKILGTRFNTCKSTTLRFHFPFQCFWHKK